MANGISATTVWEVENGGSDTACSGGFDPAVTMPLNDLACTTGTTGSATTTVTSASNPWVAGDTNAWLFIQSGTGFKPGWYKFTYVGAGSGTIDTRAGSWIAYPIGGSTAAGCGTVASCSSGLFTMDYSQQAAAAATWTNTLRINDTAVTDSGAGFRPVYVGNVIEGGAAGTGTLATLTAFTDTSNMVATTGGTDTGAGVAGYLGGAFATVGNFGAKHIAGNTGWVKYHATAYTATNNNNAAAGRVTGATGTVAAPVTLRGYDVVRGDETSNRPTYRSPATLSNNALFTTGAFNYVSNIIFDGASQAATAIQFQGASCAARRVKALNCAGSNGSMLFNAANSSVVDFEVSGGSPVVVGGQGGIKFIGGYSHGSTGAGFTISTGTANWKNVIFDSNTGAGVSSTGAGYVDVDNCTFYNNGVAGVDFTAQPNRGNIVNSAFEDNATFGIKCAAAYSSVRSINNEFYNNATEGAAGAKRYSGIVAGTLPYGHLTPYNVVGEVLPSGSVFNVPASQNFQIKLNGAGSTIATSGFPQTFPGLTWSNYPSIGATNAVKQGETPFGANFN